MEEVDARGARLWSCRGGGKETMLGELFAIFYVDDGYIASRDPNFL